MDLLIASDSGTAGTGRETILQLAAHDPVKIIFTGRNKTAANALISQCETNNVLMP